MNSRVLGGAVRTVRYGYDAVGNRTTLEQANGVSSTTTYDQRNRLKQLLTRTAAGLLLFGATYEVDASGARTAIAEFDASGPTRSVSYAYDGTKRLVAETIARPGQADRTTRYVYDAVGNRLARTVSDGPGTTYAVDANDRLISETTGGITTLYTYDANGNTTGKAKPGEWTRYGYDEENRLVDTTTSAGASLATGYNADGIRNRETANGQTTTWLIDPNRDYAQTLEASRNGTLATVWIYGNELLAQSNAGLHETHLHTDGLGSVRQATDALGAVTDGFEYDAFGNELARTGTTAIDHRYRGEQLDPNTGFYNLRARWYDPSVGRLDRLDPWIGDETRPTSLNKYTYAENDPVQNSDPSGLATLIDQMQSLGLDAMRALRTFGSASRQYRSATARLCAVCAQLAKPYNELTGKLPKPFEAHHIFQNAEMARAIVQYSRFTSLAVPMLGGSRIPGSPHDLATVFQRSNRTTGKATFYRMRTIAYGALLAAGCRKSDAAEITLAAQRSFELSDVGLAF